MIPKAEILAFAEQSGLLATTIEKDYALGWMLFGIAQHPELKEWIFVRCYSLEEVLAEKTRALVQRTGRARDVYDVVNIGRNFRDGVDVTRAAEFAGRKFAYKELPSRTPDLVLAAIQRDVLATGYPLNERLVWERGAFAVHTLERSSPGKTPPSSSSPFIAQVNNS